MDYVALAQKINALDFDTVYRIVGSDVEVINDIYAPSVYHSATDDVNIDGSGWECLTGMTAQYLYNGAVMHQSEYIGATIAKRLSEMSEDDVVFATVVVSVIDGDEEDSSDDVAGWAIAYRNRI